MHSSRMRTIRSSSRLLRGGVCLSACWDTHPPGLGLDTPTRPDPPTSPLGQGLDTPGQTPNLPPGSGPRPYPVDRQTRVKT